METNEETMKQELVKNFKSTLSAMSYYNAAEGSDWGREEAERDRTELKLKYLAKNLRIHGINPKDLAAGYLVSESDYTEN